MLARLTPPPLRRPSLGPTSIREVVFGVEDGVVQNMTLIAGMVGAQLSARVIVIAAAINAIAGVLSMSMGTYLSSKAEREVAAAIEIASPTQRSPVRDATVMAGTYALGAFVPILPFVVGTSTQTLAIGIAVSLTAATLFVLGYVTAILSGQGRFRSGIEMLALAAGAGLAGYLIGIAARAIFAVEI